MAAISACPDAPRLQQLLRGLVTDREAAPLEEHLVYCATCLQTLRSLPVEDTLCETAGRVGWVEGRDPPSACPAVGAAATADLIRRLKALRPSGAAGDTPTSAPTPSPEPGSQQPVPETYDFLAPPQLPGELGRLGSYRVLQVLGSGGMGVVFRAEDVQLKRQVALKVMKPDAVGKPAARQRFLREAQAAAALEHEHIVPIYQVGEAGGVPFLAMQWLKGMSLEERLKRPGALSVPQVLRLARQMACGLAAAHERGLVHRDIKPGNLWLEPEHGGHVRILDFGLARAVADDAHLTQSGTVVGTPAYMAPEQARGEKIDPRCDLFSLGVVLYRLATGQLPFRGTTTLAVLTSLATDTPAPPRQVNPAVPVALSELIVQLLSKEPAKRPQSAREVADRLQALERQPAAPAVPPAQAPTVAFPVVTPVLRGSAPLPVAQVAPGHCSIRRRRMVAVAAALLLVIGGALLVAQIIHLQPQPLPPLPAGAPLSPLALVTHPAKLDGVESWTIETIGPRAGTGSVVYSPDSRRLATFGLDATVRIWDTATARLLRAFLGHARSPLPYCYQCLAWSRDGKYLASLDDGGTVLLWDVDAGRLVRSLASNCVQSWCLGWSPDGKAIAVGGDNGQLGLWDADSGLKTDVLKGHTRRVLYVAWSPDGRTIASRDEGQVRLWTAEGEPIRSIQADMAADAGWTVLAWSPDGKTLAVSGSKLWLWDVATGNFLRPLAENQGGAVAWLPDGKTLAYGDALWDAATAKQVRPLQTAQLRRLLAPEDKLPSGATAWSPDSKTLVTSDWKEGLRLWDMASGKPLRSIISHGSTGPGAWSSDGKTLAFAVHSDSIRLWDTESGRQLRAIPRAAFGTDALFWSRDNQSLIVTGSSHLGVYDATTGASLRHEQGGVWHGLHGLSPDGKIVATTDPDGGGHGKVVLLHDFATGQLLHKLDTDESPSVAWSPDSAMLVTFGSNQQTKVWAVDTGKPIHTFEERYVWVAWAPDGKVLGCSGSADGGKVRLCDPVTGKAARTLDAKWYFFWSPDSRSLVTGDGRIWDVASGKELRTLEGRFSGGDFSWSPDGTSVMANIMGYRTSFGIWDAAPGRLRATLVGLRDEQSLAIAPDGHYRGTPRVQREIVYVVQTARGQETLTPDEFQQKYGWKNDETRVRLTGK
jgi:WD40 repeat protein